MDGVVEVADVDDPHGDADEGDDLRELLAKLVQLLLQGGLLLLGGSHLVTNLSDLSGDAGRDGDTGGFSCGDVGSLSRAKQ